MPGLPRRGTRPGAPRKDYARWNKTRNDRAAAERAKDRWTRALESGVPLAEVEVWKDLMDPRKTGVLDFIEIAFRVRRQSDDSEADIADEADEVVVDDPYVDFVPRDAQLAMWTAIEGQWKGTLDRSCYTDEAGPPTSPDRFRKVSKAKRALRRRRGSVVNLKARQHGMSTFGMALLAERALRHVGNGMVVCHDDDSTKKLGFQIRQFIAQVPEWARPKELKDAGGGIAYEHGPGTPATVEFVTAGKPGTTLGRSYSIDWLWVSELAHWKPSAKKQLPGLLAASPKRKVGAFAVLECTAKGYDEFQRLWALAEKGKSLFVPLFCNWLMHPDYWLGFGSSEEREAFAATVGKLSAYGGAEESVLLSRGADLERLHWRRQTIDSDCAGHLPTFHQEYPTTPEEAFISTGRPVFDLKILAAWLPLAVQKTRAGSVGNLRVRSRYGVTSVEFRRQGRGWWEVFEEPETGRSYVFGADVAGGNEVHADGRTEADFSSVKIKDGLTGRTVAKLRAHVPPHDFAEEIGKATHWYGMAPGYVERNADGGMVLSYLEEMEVGERSMADVILMSERIVRLDGRKEKRTKAGFTTTVGNKRALVGQLERAITDLGMPREESKPADCPWDENTVREAMRFTYQPSLSGARVSMGAERGHDDDVISDCLAYMAKRDLEGEIRAWSKVEAPMSDDLKVMLAMAEHEADAGGRQAEVVPGLGPGY